MNTKQRSWSFRNNGLRARNREGVLSLPFRLSITVIVIALVLPICIQCISSESEELSRRAAITIAERIAQTASELSNRPSCESRLMKIEKHLHMLTTKMYIVAGAMPGDQNSSLIRCYGNNGWKTTLHADLGLKIEGICSSNCSSFIITRNSGDLVMSRIQTERWDLLILEEVC